MWKHLAGINPAAPGFVKVSITPRIHDSIGPRSVSGEFLSPKGTISSSWKFSAADTVSLSVGLPVGVEGATIVVPKPTKDGQPATTVVITLGGKPVWDGARLLGTPVGILSAEDRGEGVAFTTTNGRFEFVSTSKDDVGVALIGHR